MSVSKLPSGTCIRDTIGKITLHDWEILETGDNGKFSDLKDFNWIKSDNKNANHLGIAADRRVKV